MKIKVGLIMFACSCIGVEVFAQSFGIGAKTGFTIPTVISDNEDFKEGNSYTLGSHVGVYFYDMITDRMGFEGGVMFTQGGYSFDYGPGGGLHHTKINYLAIPLSARLKWGNFTLNPGILPSFLLSAEEGSSDVTDRFKQTDMALFIAPGFQFPIGITLGASVNLGLLNVFQETGFTSKNLGFQFSVGYTFYRKELPKSE